MVALVDCLWTVFFQVLLKTLVVDCVGNTTRFMACWAHDVGPPAAGLDAASGAWDCIAEEAA